MKKILFNSGNCHCQRFLYKHKVDVDISDSAIIISERVSGLLKKIKKFVMTGLFSSFLLPNKSS